MSLWEPLQRSDSEGLSDQSKAFSDNLFCKFKHTRYDLVSQDVVILYD